jgi:hypothetical protein
MANKFKNQNLGTYDWVPEIISQIDPAPKYHTRAIQKQMGPESWKKKLVSEGIES